MKISPFILHSGVSFRLLYIHMSKVALVLRMVVWAWVNTVRGQLMQSYVALEWLYSCPKLYQSDPPYSTMLIFPCSCCSFSKSIVNFKFISELKQKNVHLIFSRPKPLPRVTPALETVKQFAIKIVFYLLFQSGLNWFLKEHSTFFIIDKKNSWTSFSYYKCIFL